MKITKSIRFGLMAFAACMCSNKPAKAITVNSFTGPLTLNIDGLCNSVTQTRFDLAINRLQVTGVTDDGGGNDFYDVYLVDANDKILFVNAAFSPAGASSLAFSFDTDATPDAGPLSLKVTENTVAAPVQTTGATFAQTALATLTFDANALDPDCPGAGGQLTSGGISSATQSSVLRAAMSSGISFESLIVLLRHLDAITVKSGVQGVGRRNTSRGFTATAVNPYYSPQQLLAHFDSREQRDSTAYRNVTGTSNFRDAARTVLPYMSFDTAKGDALGGLFGGRPALGATATQEGLLANQLPELEQYSGDNALPFHMWLDSNFKVIDNDNVTNGVSQRFDGDILTVSTGVDGWIYDHLLAGAYVAYSSAQLDTAFNDGTYDEDAFTIAPYFLYQVNEKVTVNTSFGYTFSDIEQKQSRSTNAVTSDTSANTVFANINGKVTHDMENSPVTLVGRTGFMRSYRSIDGFTDSSATFNSESTSNSAQASVGGEVRYAKDYALHIMEPFVKLDLQYEMMDAINNDATSGVIGAGFRYYHKEKDLSGTLEGTALVGQDDYNEYSIRGNVALGFDTDMFGGGKISPTSNISADMYGIGSNIGLNFRDYNGISNINFTSGMRTDSFDLDGRDEEERRRGVESYIRLENVIKF